MKKIAFLSIALLGATSFAATPTMTFSYGAEMTERHKQESPVQVVGSYEVPKVGDGMPTRDTVATTHFVLADMAEVPAEDWESATACASDSQAALCIKEKEDLSLAWMGYSNSAWVELTGVTPAAGAWEVKMDFDYTLGTERVLVRYSVKQASGDYVALQPAGASSPWLETGIAAGKRITSVELNGWCDLTSATAESGQRQGYAETTTVEDYRMDYSGVTLEVVVGETWGVDTLVATVKEGDVVKGTVEKPLSEVQDGKLRLDLSEYMEKGKSFTYELKLTGSYSGSSLVCQKDGGTVDLPAEVPEATVSDGEINLASNAELDLSKTSLVGDTEYTVVQNQEGKKFHLRWKDSDGSYATRSGDKLTVHEGTPKNGLESFASYALGLEPTEPLDKPVAVVQEGGMQSADGVTVHVPNVVAANLPDSGVTVIHRLQRSDDKGANWSDTEVSAGPGGTLVVPFESGVLYRVNTVLK